MTRMLQFVAIIIMVLGGVSAWAQDQAPPAGQDSPQSPLESLKRRAAGFGRAVESPASSTTSAETPKSEAADPRRTFVYRVNHLPASDLYKIVGQLGRNDVQINAEPITNVIVVTAAPASFDEIRRLLTELDQAPARVSIDAEIAQVIWQDAGKAVGESPAGTRDEAQIDLTKPSREIIARLRQLEQKGQVEVLNRISLSTISNQPAFFQSGGRRSVARSSAGSRGGLSPSSARDANDPRTSGASGFGSSGQTLISAETTGTTLGVTPRVGNDGAITLLVDIEKSYLSPRPDDVAGPGLTTASLQSTVNLRDGETVVLGGFGASAKPGQSQLIVLLTARIANPKPASAK